MTSGNSPAAQELPSVGSANHGNGECKPCAFLHTKGCQNGSQCQFCHLCAPGEKKRRRKEKMSVAAVETAEPPAPSGETPMVKSVAEDLSLLSPSPAMAVWSPMPDTPQHYGDASDRIPMGTLAPTQLFPQQQQQQPQQPQQFEQFEQFEQLQQQQGLPLQYQQPQLWAQGQGVPQPPVQAPVLAPPPVQAWALEAKMRADMIRARQERWAIEMQQNYINSIQVTQPVAAQAEPAKDKDTPTKGGTAFDKLLSMVANGKCHASATSPDKETDEISPQKVSPLKKGRRGGAARASAGKENLPPAGTAPAKPALRAHRPKA
jgi:hypothetical protein